MPSRSTCQLTTSDRKDAIQLVAQVADALKPQEGDFLLAAEHIKVKIIQRTRRGVDYMEREFAPYSEKGPFYWYPAGRAGKARKAAAARANRKLKGGTLTKSGQGIRFESYAAFKRAMGSGVVDLTSPGAGAHMLGAMIVRMSGGHAIIAIYDTFAADKASGHNDGIHKTLPQREFFRASDQDIAEVSRDLEARLLRRARRVLGV